MVWVASLPLADHGSLDVPDDRGIPLITLFGLVADEHHDRNLAAVGSIELDVGDAQNRWLVGIGSMYGWRCPPKSEGPEL